MDREKERVIEKTQYLLDDLDKYLNHYGPDRDIELMKKYIYRVIWKNKKVKK